MRTLESIERRALWLAMSIVHHANRVRKTESGVKTGGHQASSASAVSIMIALWFTHLRSADRVSVKPHASPVLHAINYLLGRLDRRYLTELRAFHGLQSYPSRTKDPDPVDFSTGSVGIGATVSIWSAVAERYVAAHFPRAADAGRAIAIIGDAELDEGAVWECLLDPVTRRLGEVLWIVDLNRQSLDRVVPDIAAARLRAMFDAVGWQVLTVKYGRRLRELFARPGGEALRRRLDDMSNEEYQHLLRMPAADLRGALVGTGADTGIVRATSDVDDVQLAASIRDLGGHDLADLADAYRQADAATDRPTVIFAYTIKARRLPTEGHPGNHSALLSDAQWRELATSLGADANDPWRGFDAGTTEAELCRRVATTLERSASDAAMPPDVPPELSGRHPPRVSTQQTFGAFFSDLARSAPDVARSVVTASPDVASSTSLGTWINHAGVWNVNERIDWFGADRDSLIRWGERTNGQHIELGISEVSLVGLLGELGATWSRNGRPLLPIGTLYDPFVSRALEPWAFGMYSGGQSILVGTPSGVTLAPEGGAHQSITTPSIGLEQPGCIAWEPAFAQDLEWTLLYAMSRLGRAGGTSSYFRLTTRPIDQELARLPADGAQRERRRGLAVRGGYPLMRAATTPDVIFVGVGAVMPEVVAAADELSRGGISVDVLCLTSPDLVFRAWRARQGLAAGDADILDDLLPAARPAPIVSVLDGHPHTLAFLGSVHGVRMACLGVDDFGESGDVPDLYRRFGIDGETIAGAALDLIGR